MIEAGATSEQATQVLKLAQLSGSNDEVLAELQPLVAGSEIGETGAAKLNEVVAAVRAAGIAESRFKLDIAIARGLDYYTGTIFETFLDQLPGIGSVCSGGRYDNLAELYTNQQLPGIGASLGLDRLLAALEELDFIENVRTPADVFIAYFDKTRLHDYLRLAAQIRATGIGVEVYPESKKIGQQLSYASPRGFRVALIAGEDDFAAETCNVKDLERKSEEEVAFDEGGRSILEAIQNVLSR